MKIVTYDWLEDSLLAKRRKADRDYLLSRLTKTEAKKKEATAATRRKQLEVGGKSISRLTCLMLPNETTHSEEMASGLQGLLQGHDDR